MKHIRLGLLAGLLLCAAQLLSACGPGNNVRLLSPPPLPASSLPSPSAPSVSVVVFADKRENIGDIGIRRDGTAFVTAGNVPQWISRALADELARKGLQVTYAESVSQARSGNPDYLVTGAIEEVWLKEDSAMQISAQFRVGCALANRKGRIWSETSASTQSRSSLPTGSVADDLLLDTLQDLVRPIAQKIWETVEKK